MKIYQLTTRKVFFAVVRAPDLPFQIEGYPVTPYVHADAIVYEDGTRIFFADVLKTAGFPQGKILSTGLELCDHKDGKATWRFEVDLPG